MNFYRTIKSAALLALASFATSANAATTIDFDTISTDVAVDSYYAGGTASSGQTGPNLGVNFATGDWLTATGFGQTSQPNLAFSESGLGSVDFANGISSLSFRYGAFSDTRINLYSGVRQTGSLLTSVLLPTNDPFTAFTTQSIPFSGVARSFGISTDRAQFGFDDLTFTTAVGAAPEPATWAMMLIGFGIAGASLRRKRRATMQAA